MRARSMKRIGRREEGSVSLLAAAGMVILAVLVMASADLAKVLHSLSQAQTAADAAALAAAQEQALPSDAEPGQPAAEMASLNGATLVECTCPRGSFDAEVEVSVPVGPMLILRGIDSVQAKARAVVDLPEPETTPSGGGTG